MTSDKYFPGRPDHVKYSFLFLPIIFFDKVDELTQNKLNENGVAGFEEVNINRDHILGLIVLWFILGLVSLPSSDIYFNVGIANIYQHHWV